MNKEVKEFEKLLKLVKPERLDEYGLMIFKEINVLLDYINQLETNIDEAIKYIKHSWWLRLDQVYDTSKDLQGWEVEELLSILESGKE